VEIAELWSTPIQHGCIEQTVFEELQEHTDFDSNSPLATKLADWLTHQGIGGISGNLRFRTAHLEKWSPGFHVPIEQATPRIGEYQFFASLHRIPSHFDRQPQSGALVIHDPRAGCSNAFIPGQPFGRPWIQDFIPGEYVIFPAWLRFSILPLREAEFVHIIRAILVGELKNDIFA
jgi:hypothetical protein